MSKNITRASIAGASLDGLNLKGALLGIWDALQSVGLQSGSRNTVTATATLDMTQCGYLPVDCSAGSITLTLPASGTATDDAEFRIRRIDNTSANTLTVQRAGADTLEGAASATLAPGQQLDLKLPAGGTDWKVLGRGGGSAIGAALFTAASAAAGRNTLELEPDIIPVAASVAGNALTVTINPCTLNFRSATATDGAATAVQISAPISLTVSSGSTLGMVSGTSARLAILAINNAGTAEAAIVNMAGGVNLDESSVISTTAEGGAGGADSASTIYSTTARSNVPYRVAGYIDISQSVPGTYASAPSKVQGAGGRALGALATLGYGQTWQNVFGSRASGTTYYNTTGRPIMVFVSGSSSAFPTVTVGGVSVSGAWAPNTSSQGCAAFIVPPGMSYSVGSITSISSWTELR